MDMPQDKVNGKMTPIEMEMALDEIKSNLHYMIQNNAITAQFLKAKYDNLIQAGFNEQQALEIIKSRPVYE